ncbi:MAG TPA: DUF4136 domain-containing protein [Ramlibacter sp.]|nr:DUF4136 domain-containing protein [Ramlibacter sp.]
MHSIVRALSAAALAAVLAGCATSYKLDNQVQTYSHLAAVPAQPTYRFERSLSQQADPAQQALEALADPALHRAGFRRDDAAPRYTVQVSARTDRALSPFADPWDRWGWGGFGGWGIGLSGRHIGIGFGGPIPRQDSYWFHREVTIIVRELPANRVVYETHAVNDGPWVDNRAVLPAMFDAALQGFPNPPPGPRRVDVQVGATAR